MAEKGGGNDVNLAALWVPVMPETSGMAPAMKKAGEESKKAFHQGFTGGGGNSPEEMGRQFAGQFMRSFNSTFAGMPMPQGVRDFMGSLRRETQLTETQLARLRTTATTSFEAMGRAQRDVATHQERLNVLQQHYNKAMAEGNTRQAAFHQSRITNEMNSHSVAVAKAAEHSDKYTVATTKLGEAQRGASMSSNLMAGAIGGGVGAAVTLGISAVQGLTSAYIHMVGAGLKGAIHGTKELSEFVLRAGENYETLSHQITLFTTASGGELEALNESAARVYGTMDASAAKVGNTLGILSQRLGMEAGPGLEHLTYQLEELRDRFGQLDVEQFTAGLIAFKVPADNADESLASLVQSARNAGTPINDVIVALRTAAPTLDAAGLSYEQAAAFVAELTKRGLEARSMMTGLQTAQGEFAERGLTFQEGMAMAAQRIQDLVAAGDEATAQDLAEQLFGSRRWAEALTMMQAFSDIVGAQPGQFSATSAQTDELIDKTQTLGEKWEEVKRQAEEAVRPLGAAGLGVISTGLEKLKAYIDTNTPAFTEKVRQWGNSFLEALPGIQDFSANVIRILGYTADFVMENMAAMLAAMGAMAEGIDLALNLIPGPIKKLLGMEDTEKIADELGDTFRNMSKKLWDNDMVARADQVADWVEGLNVDVPELKDKWNNLIDDMNQNKPDAPFIGGALGASAGIGGIPSGASGIPGVGPAAGMPNAGAGSSPGGSSGGGGGGSTGGIFGSAQSGAGGTPESNKALAQQMFPWPESEWAAFDALEMKEAGYNHTADNPDSTAYGMGQFLDSTWKQYGFPATGTDDPATQLRLMFQYIKERYGSPTAALQHHLANNWYADGGWVREHFDEGGQAGGKSNWQKYISGEGIFDWKSLVPDLYKEGPSYENLAPFAAATVSYPFAAAGSLVDNAQSVMSKIPGGLGDLAAQGDWRHDWTHPWDIPGRSTSWWPTSHYKAAGGPAGTDTIPAWLTPGEFVVNADSAKIFGPMLSKMNSIRYLEGGGAADPQAAGTNSGIHYVANIASSMFGLDLTSGMRDTTTHHGSGEAGDFGMPGGGEDTDQMLAFATYMAQNFGNNLAELIYHDPRFSGKQIDEGKVTPDSTYANAGNHHDHVHVAIRSGSDMNQFLGSGQIPTGGGGSGPTFGAASGGGGFGGGGGGAPGFSGGYGPQDWEAKRRNEDAVRNAQQRASDMDYQIGEKRKQITDLDAKIAEAQAGGEVDILTGKREAPDQAAISALQDQRAAAEHDLSVTLRERNDQNLEISDAERKLAEGVKSKGGSMQEYQIPGASQFTQLGGGLIKGLGEGLGFGEIFGKAPWEWGITKLLAGGLNWGLGTANAWADQIGQGKTGLTGNTGVPLPGWEQGGSMGLMNLLGGMAPGMQSLLPKPVMVNNFGQPVDSAGNTAGVTTAPNVSITPGTGMPTPMGALGPPPGPVDASITVNNHGPKQSDYDTWKQAQNSRTEGAMGGLPRP